MPSPLRRLLPALLLAAVGSFLPHAFATVPPAEKLLPDDALVVVAAPDYQKVRDFIKSSAETRFWNDPAVRPVKDKFLTKLREELVLPLEKELAIHLDDYAELPQGQMTFAITQNGWPAAGNQPALLFVMDTQGRSGQLKTNLAEVRRKWVDAGKTLKTEKIRDLEFTAYLLSEKDVPETLKKLFPNGGEGFADASTNSAATELLVGQVETVLLAGTSAKALEKVVAHLTGGSAPALADVPAFETSRLATFRDVPFYAWANAKTFLDLVTGKSVKDDEETPNPLAMFSPDKILAATGLNSIRTVAFACRSDAEGSYAEFAVAAPAAARQNLLQLIPADGKESSPPPFVPADAIKFQRSRLDGQKAWATLQKALNEISPQIMNGVNFALDTANTAAKQKDPDFDLQKNLFGNLGDDLISYSKAPRAEGADGLNSAPSLFLIGSPRPEELANAFKSVFVLLTAQGGTPSEREFLGRKIYSVQLPALAIAAGGGKTTTLSYAPSGGYVAVTTDAAMLEEYLRRSESQQKALRETAGLMEAIQKVGGASVGIFGYQNNLEISKLMFEAARKTQAKDTGSPLPGMDFPAAGDGFKDWVDFTLMPPFDQVAKYFYFSVYGVSANADGITMRMFAPTPPELRK
ncbi:MAG: hypothetical protein U1F65_11615 [Verrucomicrobiota bacterium]